MKKLKKFDMFGYRISINLESSEDVYKTSVGAIFSIMFIISLAVIFYIDLIKLINHE
jgi:hypothetical protein